MAFAVRLDRRFDSEIDFERVRRGPPVGRRGSRSQRRLGNRVHASGIPSIDADLTKRVGGNRSATAAFDETQWRMRRRRDYEMPRQGGSNAALQPDEPRLSVAFEACVNFFIRLG